MRSCTVEPKYTATNNVENGNVLPLHVRIVGNVTMVLNKGKISNVIRETSMRVA